MPASDPVRDERSGTREAIEGRGFRWRMRFTVPRTQSQMCARVCGGGGEGGQLPVEDEVDRPPHVVLGQLGHAQLRASQNGQNGQKFGVFWSKFRVFWSKVPHLLVKSSVSLSRTWPRPAAREQRAKKNGQKRLSKKQRPKTSGQTTRTRTADKLVKRSKTAPIKK